ncbi:MAG: hypothetical protein AAF752_08650 [Bacteroidota bacterium]
MLDVTYLYDASWHERRNLLAHLGNTTVTPYECLIDIHTSSLTTVPQDALHEGTEAAQRETSCSDWEAVLTDW